MNEHRLQLNTYRFFPHYQVKVNISLGSAFHIWVWLKKNETKISTLFWLNYFNAWVFEKKEKKKTKTEKKKDKKERKQNKLLYGSLILPLYWTKKSYLATTICQILWFWRNNSIYSNSFWTISCVRSTPLFWMICNAFNSEFITFSTKKSARERLVYKTAITWADPPRPTFFRRQYCSPLTVTVSITSCRRPSSLLFN